MILSEPGRSGGDEPAVESIRGCVHKRRALNTRLSSGTSAGTFAVSAGPYRNYQSEAGTKNEPDTAIKGREHYTALSQHPAIFWHFCGNFHSVRGPLQKLSCQSSTCFGMIIVRKTNLDMFLVPFQKKGWKIDHHVSNPRTRGFLFQRVYVHP